MTPLPPPQAFSPSRPGLTISRSCRVKAGSYLLKGGDTVPALTVRGDGITVDFTGVVLRGTAAEGRPDARAGLGVLIEGKNVTVRGLQAHGYKIGLLARKVQGLRLIDCDLSYNWRQRLLSTPEKEDLADWMSFHHNEKGEWRGQGVGAYLDRCEGFEVKGLRVTGGQSGLFLDRSNKGLVWNCDLSFNSALGIGMYRASDDRIMHNRLDYDVRGFSYGVYNRGQDSAAILVFEQCDRNVFAFNSATHGGDGFFLWAGQSTMDTGAGGCDDNLVYGNDFSHAVTNGIEATFSRNAFVGNRVHGAFHGVWGGYSHDTQIVGNDFARNQRGIAIEHGGENEIAFNAFHGDDVAVALWADPPDPAFEYAKRRDVRSRNNRIVGNVLYGNALGLDLRGTTDTLVEGNSFRGVLRAVRVPEGQAPFAPLQMENGATTAVQGLPGTVVRPTKPDGPERVWSPTNPLTGAATDRVAPLKGGRMAFLRPIDAQGWSTILVDEWGPYDFRRPLLVEERTAGGAAPVPGGTSAGSGVRKAAPVAGTGRYQILGPKGKWRLVRSEGAKLGVAGGTIPGFVKIDVAKGRVGTTKVELEYVGEATTDVRGIVTPAGKPVRFGFSTFAAPIDWSVSFCAWKESENGADPHAAPKDFSAVLASTPLRTVKVDRLDFAGYAFLPGLPATHVATSAEGTFTIPPGEYTIELTTDDGARVWLDGKPLIEDAWHYQGPTAYSRTVHLGGAHRLRVEHFQIDGYAALRLSIKPKG